MNDENLTASQWQAIAEKLAEYLENACMGMECEDCQLLNDCKISDGWLNQAKKELGYE